MCRYRLIVEAAYTLIHSQWLTVFYLKSKRIIKMHNQAKHADVKSYAALHFFTGVCGVRAKENFGASKKF
ncbi:hypothetical protein NM74_10940 [Aeromonas hydrophila]|nr:hypothetical protein NM74_10940 [Aeromonas hydrophila]